MSLCAGRDPGGRWRRGPASARALEAALSLGSGDGAAARGLVEWPSKALSPSLCPRRAPELPNVYTRRPGSASPAAFWKCAASRPPRPAAPASACPPGAGAVGARSPRGTCPVPCPRRPDPGSPSVRLGPGGRGGRGRDFAEGGGGPVCPLRVPPAAGLGGRPGRVRGKPVLVTSGGTPARARPVQGPRRTPARWAPRAHTRANAETLPWTEPQTQGGGCTRSVSRVPGTAGPSPCSDLSAAVEHPQARGAGFGRRTP